MTDRDLFRMTPAEQCRALKIKVGDTIFGREDTCGYWHEVELTLLYIGEDQCVWSERSRSNANDTGDWSGPKESTNWNLGYRDWKKIK